MLRWSARELSERSGISLPTVQRMESADGIPSSLGRNLDAVQRTLERAGIDFIEDDGMGPGVRFQRPKEESD